MASKSATTSNLAPNIASALCYIPFVGWIAAIVLFIIEKNTVVRWNAVQSVLLALALWVVSFVLGLTIILALLVPLVMVAGLIINLILAIRVYQGNTVRLPLLAGWSDMVVKKA